MTNNGDDGPGSLFTSFRRRHGPERRIWPLVLLVVVLAAVGSGGWYYFHSRHAATSAADFEASPTDSLRRLPSAASTDSAAAPLPDLDQSDGLVRQLAEGLSSRPRVASWLTTKDLVRRFVVAVADVASGQSPRPRLGFMAPKGAFRVRESGTQTLVDPSSYHRYDALTDAFASLNDQGVAELYHRIRPLCDQAYRELGLPGGTFEDALERAFGRLLAVQVPDSAQALVPQGGEDYAYADPGIEALSPAAKNLLRLGPQNAARVQSKLRELAAAMGVQPRDPGEGGNGRSQAPQGLPR